MSHMLEIPDELYESLASLAAQRQESLQEALASLLSAPGTDEGIGRTGASAAQTASTPSDATEVAYQNPWEGYYGAFEIDPPDAIERHDYYIGQGAIDPHDDEDENAWATPIHG